jgi:3-hydroxymyristoyl/3-hydroxydecanoyl-(acyl carrier protein) dehydratase
MSFQPLDASLFIPQKTPFVMVDKLLYADEKTAETSFEICAGNLFVNNGFFSTPGMVESMAQTAAAGTGYTFKKENKEIPIGYIGAVQNLKVFDWPPVNSTIRIELTLVTKILQVSLVSGTVRLNNRVIASCDMKIFVDPKI